MDQTLNSDHNVLQPILAPFLEHDAVPWNRSDNCASSFLVQYIWILAYALKYLWVWIQIYWFWDYLQHCFISAWNLYHIVPSPVWLRRVAFDSFG